MRQEGIVHVLKKERSAVERVQRDAVGPVGAEASLAGACCVVERRDCFRGHVQLHQIQLLLLGQNVLNVWLQRGVQFEHFGADGALCAGFDL